MEIMVVVLILGLIAGYAIPRYLAGIRTAKLGQVTSNYETVRTETWAAYYVPGSTETTAAQTVGKQTVNLTNPFGASSSTRQPVVITPDGGTTYDYWNTAIPTPAWGTYNSDTLAGGEIVLDYSVAEVPGTSPSQITVTAYDDSSTPASMKTEIIKDPKF